MNEWKLVKNHPWGRVWIRLICTPISSEGNKQFVLQTLIARSPEANLIKRLN